MAHRDKTQAKELGYRKSLPLPPGLTNHTNTCFFNSTLQALIATSLLEDAIRSRPIPRFQFPPPPSQTIPPASPALLANQQGPVPSSMPLCKEFLGFLADAYNARDAFKSVPLSPRNLLASLGSKHNQYLDFRQQDAHELLRQLLDDMQMEEADEIKRRGIGVQQTSAEKSEGSISFVDMIFGGQLASVLVCDRCKHVSHTYENFMDLSLSLKTDEVNRKRDRLLQFVQKLRKTSSPGSQSSVSVPPSTNLVLHDSAGPGVLPTIQVETPRSQSVPPGSPFRNQAYLDPPAIDARRRSAELPLDTSTPVEQFSGQEVPKETRVEGDGSSLGRRVSVRLGLKPAEKTRGRPKRQTGALNSDHHTLGAQAPSPRISPHGRTGENKRSPSPSGPTPKSLRARKQAYMKALLHDTPIPHAHEHQVWQYVSDAAGHVSALRSSEDASATGNIPWSKFGERGGIVGCLKQFTAVETLQGDNAFACKRCWKRENRALLALYKKQRDQARPNGTMGAASPPDSDEDDTDTDTGTPPSRVPPHLTSHYPSQPVETILPAPRPVRSVDVQRLESLTMPTQNSTPSTESVSSSLISIPIISKTSAEGVTDLERHPSTPSTTQASSISSKLLPEVQSDSLQRENGPDEDKSSNLSKGSTSDPPISLPPKSERVVQTRAYKRYLISAPPPVLVIHLKRFQQITRSPMAIFGTLRKVDDYVPFPEWLDLTGFIAPRREDFGLMKPESDQHSARHRVMLLPSEDDRHRGSVQPHALYRLSSVVVHIGNMLGGHYTAYSALPVEVANSGSSIQTAQTTRPSIHDKERRWCFVSDTVVRVSSLEEALKAKAYLCFYERVR